MMRYRIVSLLPSATEILILIEQEAGLTSFDPKLAYTGQLVGRSHECDFPSNVSHLPILTASRLTETKDSLAIHNEVIDALKENNSLYTMKRSLLEELKPEIVLTQNLCDVCSIDLNSVERTINLMNPKPRVVNLEPISIEGVFDSILKVGISIDQVEAANRVVSRLQNRMTLALDFVKKNSSVTKPKVEMLEWLKPIFPGGHWTAEMLLLAGGDMVLNLPNEVSTPILSDPLIAADPEFLIVAPCGFDLDITRHEFIKFISDNSDWLYNLKAAKQQQVYLVDGNQHFNRPGPRLVDAFEFIVAIIYNDHSRIPECFPYEHYPLNLISSNENKEHSPASILKVINSSTLETDVFEIEDCHRAACNAQKLMYEDKSTGLWVMTEYALLKRGTCCGNGCRHCPYGHFNVKKKKRISKLASDRVTLCRIQLPDEDDLDIDDEDLPQEVTQYIIFWSGGKDSYLSLIYLFERNILKKGDKLFLMTTFDSSNQVVPCQNISIKKIMDQAKHLQIDLIAVPLPSMASNDVYLHYCNEGIKIAENCTTRIYSLREIPLPKVSTQLVFSDLLLQDVRDWKALMFTNVERNQTCIFPIFSISYSELQKKLFSYHNQDESVTKKEGSVSYYKSITISNVETLINENVKDLTIGVEFNEDLVTDLTERKIDTMGEDGSFYTYVRF